MADFVERKIRQLATMNAFSRSVLLEDEPDKIIRDIEMMRELVEFLDEFNALDEEKKMFNDYTNYKENKDQIMSNELNEYDENLCGEILLPNMQKTSHNPYWFMNERKSKK